MSDQHDPGGKARLRMIDGVDGDAEFSPCGRYRYWLSRDWGFRRHSDGREPFALWIGMNPSTAEAQVDDPTIRKEMGFTRHGLGLDRYVKVNVMDYRATLPRDLRALGVTPCSDRNLDTIVDLVACASLVVACWGKVHRSLRRHPDAVLIALRGHRMLCLGRNGDGSPRHPLYLAADTKFEDFR